MALIMGELQRRGRVNPHTLAYQSRVGPVEWLKPYTDDSIRWVCVFAFYPLPCLLLPRVGVGLVFHAARLMAAGAIGTRCLPCLAWPRVPHILLCHLPLLPAFLCP